MSSTSDADQGRNRKMCKGGRSLSMEEADKRGEISLKKGTWTKTEDTILKAYVEKHGERNWIAVQKNSGLARCGQSCRFRWMNHLRPGLKKVAFTKDEEQKIIELHAIMGSKWCQMAAKLPGRTDNAIKNFWNSRIKRMQQATKTNFPEETELYRQVSNEANQYNNNQSDNITKLPSSSSLNDLISCDQFGNVLSDTYAAFYGNNYTFSDPGYSLPPLIETVDTLESSVQFQPNQSIHDSHQNNDSFDSSVQFQPNQSVHVSHQNNDNFASSVQFQPNQSVHVSHQNNDSFESSVQFQPNQSVHVSHQNNDGFEYSVQFQPNQSVHVSHQNNDGFASSLQLQPNQPVHVSHQNNDGFESSVQFQPNQSVYVSHQNNDDFESSVQFQPYQSVYVSHQNNDSFKNLNGLNNMDSFQENNVDSLQARNDHCVLNEGMVRSLLGPFVASVQDDYTNNTNCMYLMETIEDHSDEHGMSEFNDYTNTNNCIFPEETTQYCGDRHGGFADDSSNQEDMNLIKILLDPDSAPDLSFMDNIHFNGDS